MSSIKHTSKAIHGEIAATLTVFAMMVMTLGVLFGASLINQGTPQTQTEAFGVDGVDDGDMPTNPGLSVDYTRLDRSRSTNPDQAVLNGTICFDENPPLNGRFKVEVYANTASGTVLAGAAVEKTANPPQNFRCSNGRPTSFGAVFNKLPEGVTAAQLTNYKVRLRLSNAAEGGWSSLAITSDTDIATIDKDAVLTAQSGEEGATATPGPATNTPIPSPSISLPPADMCWSGCRTGVASSFGENDSCGPNYTCVNTQPAGGIPLPGNPCDNETNSCKCLPNDKQTCRDATCACGDKKLCDQRIVVSGRLNITGDVPTDSSGRKYRFKVHACEGSWTQSSPTQCSAVKYGEPILVDSSNPTFTFSGLPQQNLRKIGIYVDEKMYKPDVNEDAGIPVPNYVNLEAENCVDTSPSKPAGVSYERRDARKQQCFISFSNDANPACKVENANFKVPLPTLSPVPSATPTTVPTATPVPSEDDRRLTLVLELANHTKCVKVQVGRGYTYRCDKEGIDISGVWKGEVCGYKNSEKISCADFESDDIDDLSPGDADDPIDTHHITLDDVKYVLPPEANKIKITECELAREGAGDIECPDSFDAPKTIAKDRRGVPLDDVVTFGFDITVKENGDPETFGSVKTNTDRSDISGNSCVNIDDYSKLIIVYGKTSEQIQQINSNFNFDGETEGGEIHRSIPEDVNGDGIVNAFDMAILLTNLNQGDNCAFNK